MGILIEPENLASCPVCACLVLVWPVPWEPHAPLIFDPGTTDRRMVRSLLPRSDVERQGFGVGWGTHHECPPEELCCLKESDRRRHRDPQGAPPWN